MKILKKLSIKKNIIARLTLGLLFATLTSHTTHIHAVEAHVDLDPAKVFTDEISTMGEIDPHKINLLIDNADKPTDAVIHTIHNICLYIKDQAVLNRALDTVLISKHACSTPSMKYLSVFVQTKGSQSLLQKLQNTAFFKDTFNEKIRLFFEKFSKKKYKVSLPLLIELYTHSQCLDLKASKELFDFFLNLALVSNGEITDAILTTGLLDLYGRDKITSQQWFELALNATRSSQFKVFHDTYKNEISTLKYLNNKEYNVNNLNQETLNHAYNNKTRQKYDQDNFILYHLKLNEMFFDFMNEESTVLFLDFFSSLRLTSPRQWVPQKAVLDRYGINKMTNRQWLTVLSMATQSPYFNKFYKNHSDAILSKEFRPRILHQHDHKLKEKMKHFQKEMDKLKK